MERLVALLARSSRPANWGALAALAAGCPPPLLATSSLQQYSSASSAAPPASSTSTSGAGGRATARPKRVTKQAFLSAAAAAASGGAGDEGTELLLRQHQQAATANGSVGRHADTIRALRSYNYSLPALRGQVVLARVLRVTSQHVHVDPGFHSITDVPRTQLDVGHVHQPAEGQPLADRTSSSDLRVGDVVTVRVDALYTPYGDMQVEAVQQDPSLKQRALWLELDAAWQAGRPVLGRVLNQCPGGYAVGVSGFVALLPYASATTPTVMRIGELAPFLIEQLSEQQQLIVLRDGRMAAPPRRGPRL